MRLFYYPLICTIWTVSGFDQQLHFHSRYGTQERSIMVVGHRGFAGLYPENTLIAISKAIEIRVDRIEIDVHQTKDGKIVVIHDEKINRTTKGKGRVKELLLEEITSFSAGENFAEEFKEERVPTLQQVIELIDGRCELIIEIKKGSNVYPHIEEKIVQVIKDYNATSWCIVQSFNTIVVQKVHDLNGEIRLHQLLLRLGNYDIEKTNFVEEVSLNSFFLNERDINTLHNAGMKVNAWTVNNESGFQKMIQLGVDGIITDRPDMLLHFLKGPK